jgi:hypothetical protein
MPVSASTVTLARNAHTPTHQAAALTLAVRLRDTASELAGFQDGAELPPQLELDVAANLAAADGLLARALQVIEASRPR